MKVYIKIHCRNDIETIACCDENLLNQIFNEGNLRIEISSHFFGGDLLPLEDAIEILKGAPYFNIIGENIIQKAIECEILLEEWIQAINGIPMALKMMF